MREPNENNDIGTNNKLSILIAQDGLSFCASNQQQAKISVFAEKKFDKTLEPDRILEQIELIFEKNKLDFNAVRKAFVIYSNNLYGFVPQAFFDENHLSDYLKFNTKILPTDFIAHDELSPLKLNNVYIPFTNINNYFFDKFGSFEYAHATSILVKNLLSLETEPQKETVFVNVYYQHFDVVVAKNNTLVLCNTFSFGTPEDFVYYILFVAEQLKLDPEKFPLIFLGSISEESKIFEICYRYIRNCTFLHEEQMMRDTFDLSKFPSSKPNYVLLKSHACE